MGIKFKPDPLVSYKTDKTVKTESKPIEEERQVIDNNNNDETVENDENIISIEMKKLKVQIERDPKQHH